MGTGSSIFAEPSGDGATRSTEDGSRSVFRDRVDESTAADDEDGAETEAASDADTEGPTADSGDAAMTVFVDGERREFVFEET